VTARAPSVPAPRGRPLAVDIGGSLNLVGTLVKYLGTAALFPTVVALGYGEPFWSFLLAGALTTGFGLVLERLTHGGERIGFREGYLVISVTWLLAAVFGALPYLIAGDPQLGRPVDAFFEGMSGFTTTGATVTVDVDALDRSVAMWRVFTQWLGGMGIVVLAVAVLPRLRVGGRQLFEAELPGPEVDQLAARIGDTARRLWLLYVGLTGSLFLILSFFALSGIDDRMTIFDAAGTAFSTIPTGGFGMDARSLEPFAAASQWVVALFMITAGVNYVLLYRALLRREHGRLARDDELRVYLALLALGSTLLLIELWTEGIATGEAAVRHAVFQASSVMTTTGLVTLDFAGWPTLALVTLIGLMFIGGSAGSTSGSIKVIRHLMVWRLLSRELRQTVHPEEVMPIRFNRSIVDERTLRAIIVFLFFYIGLFAAGAVVIAIDTSFQGPAIEPLDAVAASATTITNVGPGVGLAGPMGSFEPFSDVSTIVMTLLMWLGRLELLPVIVLFTRHYWRA
jgi:trk system potassium uptake protein TrkH